MSAAAKFLVTTLGGGLLLGAIGGHLARPVMLEKDGGEPRGNLPQPAFDAAESPATIEILPEGPNPYGGRYSYAPAYANNDGMEAWVDPYEDPEWLEYTNDWPDPPTVAELDARLAEWEARDAHLYGRTLELPDLPQIDDAATEAEEAAGEARTAADDAEPDPLPPEPRVAGGELPAIW